MKNWISIERFFLTVNVLGLQKKFLISRKSVLTTLIFNMKKFTTNISSHV